MRSVFENGTVCESWSHGISAYSRHTRGVTQPLDGTLAIHWFPTYLRLRMGFSLAPPLFPAEALYRASQRYVDLRSQWGVWLLARSWRARAWAFNLLYTSTADTVSNTQSSSPITDFQSIRARPKRIIPKSATMPAKTPSTGTAAEMRAFAMASD